MADRISLADFDAQDPVEFSEVFGDVIAYNDRIDALTVDRLYVFLRVFCSIDILFFTQIGIAVAGYNYASPDRANLWQFDFQLEAESAGFEHSIAATWQLDFDIRRHRHLKDEDLSRQLQQEGLLGALPDVSYSSRCSSSACEAIAEFFDVSPVLNITLA